MQHGILCGTRPWSAGGGRGELSHHAPDDRHEGGTKSGPVGTVRGTVRLSRVVPSLLVSDLHFRSAPWAFAALKEEEIGISYTWMQKTPKNAIDLSRSTF
jgi:hypothetical protein